VAQPAAVEVVQEPVPAAAPPAGAITRGLSLDVASVIDDLFDAGRMSWELVEYFEQTYQNVPVRWAGKVTSRERYRTDRDFGPGPGVRAMLLLGSVGGSDLISSQVHAAVALPAGTEINVGDQIQVEGLLTHADRFSRNLWIEQARLAGR